MANKEILLPLEVNTDILLNLNLDKLYKGQELQDFIKEMSSKLNTKKIKIERSIKKTLSFLVRSGLLTQRKENNKTILKFSDIFISEYMEKYKFNFLPALQQFYEDMYNDLLDLKNKTLLNIQQAEEALQTIKEYKNKNTLKRQATYLTSFVNKIIFANKASELDNIIKLTAKENLNKITTDIKNEVFKIVLQELSVEEEINDDKIKAIKKVIFDSNLLANVIENNYNNSLGDFFANILERPELSQEINFKDILPNFEKGYNLLEEYIKQDKDIVLFTDVDNDGTMANAASKVFKEKLELSNFYINYVKIYPNSTVQHGINFVDVDNYLKNKYPNKKPEEIDILITTADNGSGNLEEIKKISEKYPNVKFLITDHHHPQFTKEEANSIPNLIFVNWHFAENENKEKLRKYELSGAHTWNLFLDEYLEKNYTMHFGIEKKELVKLTIENHSKLSDIADMVNGYIQMFLGKEIRENFGKNVNKLNAILTLENIINKFDKLEENKLKELLKKTFLADNVDTFFNKLKKIKNTADIIFIMEQYKNILPSYLLDRKLEEVVAMDEKNLKKELLKAYQIDKKSLSLKQELKKYETNLQKWDEEIINKLKTFQENKKINSRIKLENLSEEKINEIIEKSKKLTDEDIKEMVEILNNKPKIDLSFEKQFTDLPPEEKIDKELQKYQRYSTLYELRNIIVKYLGMPYLEEENEQFMDDLIKKTNILDNVKNLEKDMNNLLKDKIEQLATKYEKGYSKLIVFNENSIISRKLLLKLNPEINNGILIILDTINENEVYGSIRMKQFYFADVFDYSDEEDRFKEMETIKEFNKKINQDLERYGIKVKYMGHEKGAAGFKIIGIKNALTKLKTEYPKLSEKELKNILFEKLNNIFNEKYDLLKKEKIENKKQTKLFVKNINDLPLVMKILNVLKVPNFTHGDKAEVKLVIPTKDLPLVNKYGTAHQKMDIKDLKDFPKEYLTTVLNFDNNNAIYPKNLLKEALEKSYKYLELDMLSPTSLMAQAYTNEKPNISLSVSDRKQEIVKNFSKIFNKRNNFTIEMDIEQYLKEHFLVHNEKEEQELINYIDKKLKEAKAEEYVITDIEGIGFGNNNVLFNIQVLRFTKNGKVKITSLFVNPKEIYGSKFMLSPAIQTLTGTTNKMLDKVSIPILEADKILTEAFKDTKRIVFQAHNSPYDINGIETTLPKFSKLLKEKAMVLDSAPIAREHSFAIDKTERLARSYIIDKNFNKILIGTYIDNHNNALNIEQFLQNPYDGKNVLSEDQKFKLFIKKVDGKYKLYVQDLEKSSKPLFVSNVEELYLFDTYTKFDPETLKTKKIERIVHAISGKEISKEELEKIENKKIIRKNLAKGATEGTEIDSTNIKARKFSVSAIALQEASELLLDYIKTKKDFEEYYINNEEYTHTGILDIDNFYKRILNEKILNTNITDENDFINYNMSVIQNIVGNDLDTYITKYIIENDKYYTILDKKINDEKLNNEYKSKNNMVDKTFDKKLKTKKFQEELLDYKLEMIKDELLNEIKTNLLKNAGNKNFNKKLIEKLADKITEYTITKYKLNFKYKNGTDKQKESIKKQIIKLDEEIYDNIKNIVIYTFIEDIAKETKAENFFNTNIIKKIIKVYNPKLTAVENAEIIQRKFGNTIPSHIIAFIIESHNKLLNDLKQIPKLKTFLETNNIHALSEMYEEMHINASIYDSDPSFEGLLLFKRMLKEPNFKNKEYIINEYLIKTYFRDLKKDIKQLNINTFSFNQLLNAKLSTNENFKTEKVDRYLKELKENYEKEGTIPIAITNSTNNAYIVYIKYKYPLNFDNLNEIEKHIPNINHITKLVNYLYDITRLLNTGNLLTKDMEEKLVKEALMVEKYLVETYGDYYIAENPIDRLYKRKAVETELEDIIQKYKGDIDVAFKKVKELSDNIRKEALNIFNSQKAEKHIRFRTFIKPKNIDETEEENNSILNNKLRSNTLFPIFKKAMFNEATEIYDIQAEQNLKILENENNLKQMTIFEETNTLK